jgi:hypothetical protein
MGYGGTRGNIPANSIIIYDEIRNFDINIFNSLGFSKRFACFFHIYLYLLVITGSGQDGWGSISDMGRDFSSRNRVQTISEPTHHGLLSCG